MDGLNLNPPVHGHSCCRAKTTTSRGGDRNTRWNEATSSAITAQGKRCQNYPCNYCQSIHCNEIQRALLRLLPAAVVVMMLCVVGGNTRTTTWAGLAKFRSSESYVTSLNLVKIIGERNNNALPSLSDHSLLPSVEDNIFFSVYYAQSFAVILPRYGTGRTHKLRDDGIGENTSVTVLASS